MTKGLVAMRGFFRYFIVLVMILAVACALLFVTGRIPQSALKQHMLETMDQLVIEGVNPGVLYAGHPRSSLDNYSESRILLQSYFMDTSLSPAAILTNPGWEPADFQKDTLFSEMRAAVASDASPNLTYTRYWMGFRAIVRPLMLLMNYMDMRQLIQWTFLLLFGAVTLLLYRRTGSFWIALGFVFAISQLNPIVISGCFQYSTCFLIAMIGMLFSLTSQFRRYSAQMMFFVLGAATQYFDFYTAPILTFGLPMLALLLRTQYNPAGDFRLGRTSRLAFTAFAAWMAAYLAMWLSKLALTAVFTNENAFVEAFERVRSWVFEPSAGGSIASMIPLALFYCAINLVDLVPLILEGSLLVGYGIRVLRIRPQRRVWREQLIYILVALLPLLWIAAAAKPAYDHMYFQYRGLGVTLFAGILFLLGTAFPKSTIIEK